MEYLESVTPHIPFKNMKESISFIENNPSETKITLKRLISLGESRENAMRYIASVLSIELYDIIKEEKPFNYERHIENLIKLPALPEGISYK